MLKSRAQRLIKSIIEQYTTNCCIKKAYTRFFYGNNSTASPVMTGRKGKFRMKQRENSAAGMVVGMATGAVLGAAGAMMATQSKRQMRRNVRKVMKGAENAVMQLDKMAADFVEKHIDC